MTPIRISILGSTGSIGRSALDVVRHYPGRFEVVALAAHSSEEVLAAQIREFKPAYVAMADEGAGKRLASLIPNDLSVWTGMTGLEELASVSVDVVLCAVVGAAGLKPMLKAIESSRRIAVANKEALVMAGAVVMDHARKHQTEVLPVDSEHSAIFQCLQGHQPADVGTVYLTASGGPFYGRTRQSLKEVTPEEAANHPTWDMGPKISVDSATLMNKGLEVIEATWLFELPPSAIQVVIHPQSIVHSLVEFTDGNMLAHLGVTDMKFPIQFALTWPERVESPMDRLDLTAMKELTFAAPDFSDFPCLRYALDAVEAGGTAPAILNGANEEAVAAFCQKRIPFLGISEVVYEVVAACPASKGVSLEDVVGADGAARGLASKIIEKLGAKS